MLKVNPLKLPFLIEKALGSHLKNNSKYQKFAGKKPGEVLEYFWVEKVGAGSFYSSMALKIVRIWLHTASPYLDPHLLPENSDQ